jgi:FkbM family methyltransferase
MNPHLKTVLRTTQSLFPWLKQPKDWIYHHGRKLFSIPHELDFKALQQFPDRPDDLYLDVGANQGQSIASIRLFKPKVKLVSFEANPLLAHKLRRLYTHDRNLEVHDYGLAAEKAEFMLYTPSYAGFVYDGLASFSRTNALNWLNNDTIVGFNESKVILTETPCFAEKLDNLNLKPSFIKMDIQGFEYEALRGGEATIAACRPILLIEEFHSDPRMAELLGRYDYEEYVFQNNRFEKGAGALNSFLMTRESFKRLKR